jgi:small-conductance mechanosensitive channel
MEGVMDFNALIQSTSVTLVAVAWKVAGAVALWLVGRWLISFALRMVGRAFNRQRLDVTLARYTQTALSIVLNVALVVAVLGFFGVETTTFAALIAAGGVAIGVAWGGLLANFAAGAFLVFLRPFKVGDFVTAGHRAVRHRDQHTRQRAYYRREQQDLLRNDSEFFGELVSTRRSDGDNQQPGRSSRCDPADQAAVGDRSERLVLSGA